MRPGRTGVVLDTSRAHERSPVSRLADGRIAAVAGPDRFVIDTPVELRGEDFRTVGGFPFGEGDQVSFTLT